MLDLLQSAVVQPLNGLLEDESQNLSRRSADGTDAEKLADALIASRAATRRTYPILGPAMILTTVLALFFLGGIGAAVTGLILVGAGVGGCPDRRGTLTAIPPGW
jgi:hypothetical protein